MAALAAPLKGARKSNPCTATPATGDSGTLSKNNLDNLRRHGGLTPIAMEAAILTHP